MESSAFVAKPFVPAEAGDSRSPCPALNALANHKYLPHDGRDLRFFELVNVLGVVYRLSTPLAIILATVGYLLCGTFTCKPRSWTSNPDNYQRTTVMQRIVDTLPIPRLRLDLHDLAKHGRIEHDASLGHDDALPGARFAPSQPDLHLVNELALAGSDSRPTGPGFPASETKETTNLNSKGTSVIPVYGGRNMTGAVQGLTLNDIALARFNRNSTLPPGRTLSTFHKLIASGECALLLSVLSTLDDVGVENKQIPRRWIKEWFGAERLPLEWVPPKETISLSTVGKLRTLVVTEVARLERYS